MLNVFLWCGYFIWVILGLCGFIFAFIDDVQEVVKRGKAVKDLNGAGTMLVLLVSFIPVINIWFVILSTLTIVEYFEKK